MDKADKLASALGALLGLAGLALTLYGTFAARSVPETQHNEISGGTFHGPVVQAGEIPQLRLGAPDEPPGPAQ